MNMMVKKIHPKDVTLEQQACIVDVRTRDEFMRQHIPYSINIPLDELGQSLSKVKEIEGSSGQPVILTCQSGKRAEQAADIFEQVGLNFCLLEGSLVGWKTSGKALNSLQGGICIMRQVQLIVGSMVLTGFFVKSLWWLTVMAGVGMLMAGVTNTCMMASILGKMPWNQEALREKGG